MSSPPLADLHRHLDGSLREATVKELAEQLNKRIPRRLKFSAGMGLDEALAKFQVTLSLLQRPEAVQRVATEMCEDAAAEGITTLEIRFAPQLHRDGTVEEILDAALEGAAGRAGFILCGLYGEPPEPPDPLVEPASTRAGVVGLDLAGGPLASHRWILEDYAPAFDRARQLGLGRTVHAGEGRDPDEIAIAIDVLHAQRIGHGTTLLDEPAIVELVLERGVTIEACPTSNVHTGAIRKVTSHPLPLWLDRGIKACVCTDNTLLSDTTLTRELEHVRAIPGMSEERMTRVIEQGHAAAFPRRTDLPGGAS